MLLVRPGQLGSIIVKSFHTSTCSLDKQLLSKLRKKTGFSFINCRKALQQFDNDFDKAEKWLKQEAEKEGWHKASKLQDRPMSHGLIGFTQSGQMASMIEVNCETDFVGMNISFKGLVAQTLDAIISKGKEKNVNKLTFEQKDLINLPTGSKTLQDLCVLKVADLGENIAIRRGVFLKAQNHQSISHYIHTINAKKHQVDEKQDCNKNVQTNLENYAFGKYGAIVLTEKIENNAVEGSSVDSTDENVLTKQLCQHIVGLCPTTLGSMEPPVETIKDDKEEKSEQKSKKKKNVDMEDLDKITEGKVEEEEETRLMDQKFIMDDKVSVRDVLKKEGIAVIDFERMACGEEIEQIDKKCAASN